MKALGFTFHIKKNNQLWHLHHNQNKYIKG